MKDEKKAELYRNIGKRIGDERRRAGYTQAYLAECIGVSTAYMSKLERGIVAPSYISLIAICGKLGLSTDYILTGKVRTEKAGIDLDKLSKDELAIISRAVNLILQTRER